MINSSIISERVNLLPHNCPLKPPASHIFLEVPGECATRVRKQAHAMLQFGAESHPWRKPSLP